MATLVATFDASGVSGTAWTSGSYSLTFSSAPTISNGSIVMDSSITYTGSISGSVTNNSMTLEWKGTIDSYNIGNVFGIGSTNASWSSAINCYAHSESAKGISLDLQSPGAIVSGVQTTGEHHIIVTVSGTTTTLWLDGTNYGSSTLSAGYASKTYLYNNEGSNRFVGTVEYIKLYDDPLSDDEINEIFTPSEDDDDDTTTKEEGSEIFTPTGVSSTEYSYSSALSSYPFTNIVGKSASAGTSYAGFAATTGRGSSSYIYILFDTSSIPENAIITSVSAHIKIYGSTTTNNRTSTRTVQLYSGTTAKGSSTSFTMAGSASTYTINGGSSWTRDEISDTRIRLYVSRSTSNTSDAAYIYVMGADVTIQYYVIIESNTILHIKQNGAWKQVTKVYQKQNGSWVEVTSLKTLFSGATNDTNSGYFIDI